MDTTAKARHPTPTCHSINPSPSESVPGISFEKLDGKWRFIPYALLSAVEFDGKDELKFHFASGPIPYTERIWNCSGNPSAHANWNAFGKPKIRPPQTVHG